MLDDFCFEAIKPRSGFYSRTLIPQCGQVATVAEICSVQAGEVGMKGVHAQSSSYQASRRVK